MGQTQAEAAVMEQTASKFEAVNDSLQSMLNSLMGQLEGLQKAWVGRGGTSFEHVKQAWAADQAKIQQALSATAESIRTSGTKYSASDSEAASRVAASNPGINLPL